MMAQAVAQGGALLRPYLVDRVTDENGQEIFDGSPMFLGQACEAETAHQLARMMVLTTTVGTARSSFRDREGRPMIPGVDVAGKTGTLHARSPFRAYDWFMGFAPADDPEIAVAGLVINEPQWRIKGHYVGRELFRRYFQLQRHRREETNE
jgi:cell division protein FtsI/penicillin-binding protein 2